MTDNAIFITGTDTDVGKTVAASWACHFWQADYWKPVQAGLSPGTDKQTVRGLAALSAERIHPSTFELTEPMSPHAAAKIDGITISLADFKRPATSKPLVIEGAGGALVPLNDKDLVVDLIKALNIPTLVVTRTTLGTINHTLMTLDVLRQRGITVAGLVMIGPENQSNKEALAHFGKTPILAHLPMVDPLNHQAIAAFPKPPPLADLLG